MIRLIRTNDPLPKVAPINTAKPFSVSLTPAERQLLKFSLLIRQYQFHV